MARTNQGGNQISENQALTLQERVYRVLSELEKRRDEIVAVLPGDISFEKFHSNASAALRRDPEILACTTFSLINAIIESAYDGLRLDGREAVLTAHNVNVGTKDRPRWEMQAVYFPMVRGLIKKILLGREVIGIDVDVIYANDEYRIVRGTDPSIHHVPLISGARGALVAVYSIATLRTGLRVSEFMTREDVLKVRGEAKTQSVWNKWEAEMWKKSVLRRHEKRLPGGRDMIDTEARRLFPQFEPKEPLAQLAPPTTPRPSRRDFAAIGHDPLGNGVSIDPGARHETATVGRETDAQRNADSDRRNEGGIRRNAAAPLPVDLPDGEAEWSAWAAETVAKIAAADKAGVDSLWNAEKARIEAAPAAQRDLVSAAMSDRLAILHAGDPQ